MVVGAGAGVSVGGEGLLGGGGLLELVGFLRREDLLVVVVLVAGGCRVYFVVMRVWKEVGGGLVGGAYKGLEDWRIGRGLEDWERRGGEGRRTVVGRAWRRRVDWWSQDWAVGR